MFTILVHSVKRLNREGSKSLSVPFIAFVLIVLINFLGGLKSLLEDQFENTLENFPVIAVVSDISGYNTDELQIEERYINLFTDPDVNFSLAGHTGELRMKKTFHDIEIPDHPAEITMSGISNLRAESLFDPEYGAQIEFLEGYDETIFMTDEAVCIISEDLLPLTNNGILTVRNWVQLPETWEWTIDPDLNPGLTVTYDESGRIFLDLEIDEYLTLSTEIRPIRDSDVIREVYNIDGEDIYFNYIQVTFASTAVQLVHLTGEVSGGERIPNDVELTVIGTVTGVGHGMIFSPFYSIEMFTEGLDDLRIYAESLSVRIADNRELSDFKSTAAMSFSRARALSTTRPFAIIVYDSEFYETLEPLRQNIIVVDIATPFIYALSIAVGFLTSVLLTRRRKAEFAVMRSIGVNKWVVFISALTEQAFLSIIGASLGFALVAIIWNYTSLQRPAIFLGFYLLGAIFASIGAARTNVMEVLRDRKE